MEAHCILHSKEPNTNPFWWVRYKWSRQIRLSSPFLWISSLCLFPSVCLSRSLSLILSKEKMYLAQNHFPKCQTFANTFRCTLKTKHSGSSSAGSASTVAVRQTHHEWPSNFPNNRVILHVFSTSSTPKHPINRKVLFTCRFPKSSLGFPNCYWVGAPTVDWLQNSQGTLNSKWPELPAHASLDRKPELIQFHHTPPP